MVLLCLQAQHRGVDKTRDLFGTVGFRLGLGQFRLDHIGHGITQFSDLFDALDEFVLTRHRDFEQVAHLADITGLVRKIFFQLNAHALFQIRPLLVIVRRKHAGRHAEFAFTEPVHDLKEPVADDQRALNLGVLTPFIEGIEIGHRVQRQTFVCHRDLIIVKRYAQMSGEVLDDVSIREVRAHEPVEFHIVPPKAAIQHFHMDLFGHHSSAFVCGVDVHAGLDALLHATGQTRQQRTDIPQIAGRCRVGLKELRDLATAFFAAQHAQSFCRKDQLGFGAVFDRLNKLFMGTGAHFGGVTGVTIARHPASALRTVAATWRNFGALRPAFLDRFPAFTVFGAQIRNITTSTTRATAFFARRAKQAADIPRVVRSTGFQELVLIVIKVLEGFLDRGRSGLVETNMKDEVFFHGLRLVPGSGRMPAKMIVNCVVSRASIWPVTRSVVTCQLLRKRCPWFR